MGIPKYITGGCEIIRLDFYHKGYKTSDFAVYLLPLPDKLYEAPADLIARGWKTLRNNIHLEHLRENNYDVRVDRKVSFSEILNDEVLGPPKRYER